MEKEALWQQKIHLLNSHQKLLILENRSEAVITAAEHFLTIAEQAIKKHAAFYVALSGGSTPKAIFELFRKPEYSQRIDWSRCHLFWSDERAVAPDNKESNYHMAMEAAFSHLPIPKQHIYRMAAEENLAQHARLYESLVRDVVPHASFDLMMLGVGEDGHTASLFPHTEALHVQDRLVVENHVPQKDCWRMTMTYPCINAARHIAIYALGRDKASILAKVLQGPEKPEDYPVQRVGNHKHPALWIIDREAASDLQL